MQKILSRRWANVSVLRESPAATSGLGFALHEKFGVIKAVMLRDMRTRYLNHGVGFLVVIFWPLVHMLILLVIYSLIGRRAPYGTSLNLFFATGLIPTLAFLYTSRFMALSLNMNAPMMSFPIVRPLDIMAGRALLEVVAACLYALLTFVILLSLGDDPVPFDVVSAVEAFVATLFLAIGVGTLVSVLTIINPLIMTAYILFGIVIYITSGTLFVASALPSTLMEILSWNPVVHAVEWMRTAYYPGYPAQILDKSYIISFGAGSMLLGLVLERLLRRRILD